MKEYKLNVYNTLCEKAGVCRKINFYDVCKSIGVKHLKAQEVHEITAKFLREFPSYHAVRFLDQSHIPETQSDFTSLVLTDCEYENAIDAQKIHNAILNKTGVHPCEKWISDDVQFSISQSKPECGLLHLQDCGCNFQRTERYEYLVDYSRDYIRDANGNILDNSIVVQNIRLLQIIITPVSTRSIYFKNGMLGEPIVIDLNAEIVKDEKFYLIPNAEI